jgi:hypothetical protein
VDQGLPEPDKAITAPKMKVTAVWPRPSERKDGSAMITIGSDLNFNFAASDGEEGKRHDCQSSKNFKFFAHYFTPAKDLLLLSGITVIVFAKGYSGNVRGCRCSIAKN